MKYLLTFPFIATYTPGLHKDIPPNKEIFLVVLLDI